MPNRLENEASVRPSPARVTRQSSRPSRRRGGPGLLAVLVLLGVLLACLSGCAGATRFRVSVDGLAAPRQPEGRRVLIVPADATRGTAELQFQEFARAVEVGLAERGFERVEVAEAADLVVAIAWRVGEPQSETILYPRPAHAYFDPYVGRRRHKGRGGQRRDPYFSQWPRATVYDPVGRTVHTVNRVLVMTASAIEADRPPGEGRPLWSTTVESRGGDDDLRRVFPVLVSAAVPYLATDTGERVETVVREDDALVTRIRAGRSIGGPDDPAAAGENDRAE